MLNSISFRIAALASIVLLSSGSCNLCKAHSANNEAANGNTRLLDKPAKIEIAASPNAAQSKAELQTIKEWANRIKK